MKISLTKKLLSGTKNHTIMPNYGAPGCTNWSTTHPEKSFHWLSSYQKKEWGTCGWGKLIEIYFQKNYLPAHTTLNLNVLKGSQAKIWFFWKILLGPF